MRFKSAAILIFVPPTGNIGERGVGIKSALINQVRCIILREKNVVWVIESHLGTAALASLDLMNWEGNVHHTGVTCTPCLAHRDAVRDLLIREAAVIWSEAERVRCPVTPPSSSSSRQRAKKILHVLPPRQSNVIGVFRHLIFRHWTQQKGRITHLVSKTESEKKKKPQKKARGRKRLEGVNTN